MGLQKIFSGRFFYVVYITVAESERAARNMFCVEQGKPECKQSILEKQWLWDPFMFHEDQKVTITIVFKLNR